MLYLTAPLGALLVAEMRVAVDPLASRLCAKELSQPGAGLVGDAKTFSSRPFREDMLHAIEGMVAVLNAGKLPARRGLGRPLGVLDLKRECLEPGCQVDFIV